LINTDAKKKFHHPKKELPIPFFKESAAGYASWKTKKNSSMGLYEKHSLFGTVSPKDDMFKSPARGDATA
jgi:hypothetical protein